MSVKKFEHVVGDRAIPLAHRIYLVLRRWQSLRQDEIAYLRPVDVCPGSPLPVIKIEGRYPSRERPLHPTVALLIDGYARSRYLAPGHRLFAHGEVQRMEADWWPLFGSLTKRAIPVDLFNWFRGVGPGNWKAACYYLLSVHLHVDQHSTSPGGVVVPARDAIRRWCEPQSDPVVVTVSSLGADGRLLN